MAESYLICETKKDFDEIYKECYDDAKWDIEQEEHKDMLFASRITGKPDMFSIAMRWFWDVLA